MKHDRRKCLYCGKQINRHEMLYGACSDCMKRKAKLKHYGPHNNDKGAWLYADMAPRMKEYIDPHDLDDRGTMLLYRVINRDTGVFSGAPDYDKMPAWDENGEPIAQKPGPPKGRHLLYRFTKEKLAPVIPDGMKKCRRCATLIPIAGPVRCPECLKKSREESAKWRAMSKKRGNCVHCGQKLPDGYKFKNCPKCKEIFRESKMKQLESEGVTVL